MSKIILVKNIDTEEHVWGGHIFQPSEEYFVEAHEVIGFITDQQFYVDHATNLATITGYTGAISSKADEWRWLAGSIPPRVVPVQENNRLLRPYKPLHKHVNGQNQITPVTITKTGDRTYSVSGAVPSADDYIIQGHSEIRDLVILADGQDIETLYGDLVDGDALLIKPVIIDMWLPDDAQIHYLYGAFIKAKNYGDDDFIRLMVADKDGVGVGAGWYPQEYFDAYAPLILKEYDECFMEHASSVVKLLAPKTEAELHAGLYLRILYYATDMTKTDTPFWADYIVEVGE